MIGSKSTQEEKRDKAWRGSQPRNVTRAHAPPTERKKSKTKKSTAKDGTYNLDSNLRTVANAP